MRVFVHGVPETADVYGPLRAALAGPSMAVGLPGFGCDRPAGFDASKEAYVDWLGREIMQIAERTGEAVDLVGHDWGAALTIKLALDEHEALRSWAIDVAGIIHPDYVWHDTAQLWQTPEQGEAVIAAMVAAGADLASSYEAFGLGASDAAMLAGWIDADMGACILSLYRSATPNIFADWGPLGPTAPPGLIIHAENDAFSDAALGADVARSTGASVVQLDGAGHFWPLQAPEAAASLLQDFWSSLD
ncbi:MAG: alpha/beta fold hydrolase [Ilumatobacter sp.]